MTESQVDEQTFLNRCLPVNNRLGLHARVAAKIAQTVKCYHCTVVLEKDGHSAEGDSVLALLTLDAPQGSQVTIQASGPQAIEALNALEELFEQRFGEDN